MRTHLIRLRRGFGELPVDSKTTPGVLLFYGDGVGTHSRVRSCHLLPDVAPFRALLWLLVSLVGTAAVLGALALMKARVMIYLAVAFVVSDVLAVSKTMQVGLIWYFVSLLLLATALALIQRFAPAQLPVQLTRGINDSARVFVPVTMFASMMIGTRLHPTSSSTSWPSSTARHA